jgi:phosphopantetheinyl transferase
LTSISLDPWLDKEDKLKATKFVSENARLLHLAGRALLHRILRDKFQLPKGSYLLTRRPNGSPEIKARNRTDILPLHLSITHTTECVVAGVSTTGPLGVDVEARSRTIQWKKIAKSFFHKHDVHQLSQLNEGDKVDGFLQMWTRKESLGKLRGVGVLPMLGRRTPLFHLGESHDILEENGDLIHEVTWCLKGEYILSISRRSSMNCRQSFVYEPNQ